MGGLLLLGILTGCIAQHEVATDRALAPSLMEHTREVRPRKSSGAFDLLYVTDRAPVTGSDGTLSYGAERAIFLGFGTVSIVPTGSSPNGKKEFSVGRKFELGRFPATPYGVVGSTAGLRRTPAAVAAHGQAATLLRAEVARHMATAKRKEVVVFIHGYNNSFDDAARTTAEICRSLQNQFACIVMTWPAGGKGGSFFGYNIDRESSEFAVADFKKAIRIIAEAKGVERVHLLAHSRGTDVLASVVQQLAIEAYVSRSSLWQRYKIANAVFFAPDIDLDVASSKLFAWVSDPDLAFGGEARPSRLPPQGAMHLTVYSSPGDKALSASTLLSGSVLRLGQLDVEKLPKDRREAASRWGASQMGRLVDFIEFDGGTSFIGHSYFSDPAVRADLVALIRDRAKAGDPRRQLVEVKRPFWRISHAREAPRSLSQD
ncbi:MAG TPA: alpha/beta fold hydrolase [Ensifer sp.]|nr:alpha/beta fold hydrolase [Ensifer sp.]